MSEDEKNTEKKSEISINEKTIEVLIARLIPTSQYFEVRFDTLEQKFDYKFDGLNDKFDQLSRSQENLKTDMDKRFEEVSKSQENLKTDMNKRFEQVDKRFEQVDLKLDKILERIDRRIDEGLRESRSQTFRLFTFAMTFSAISMVGMLGKLFNLF